MLVFSFASKAEFCQSPCFNEIRFFLFLPLQGKVGDDVSQLAESPSMNVRFKEKTSTWWRWRRRHKTSPKHLHFPILSFPSKTPKLGFDIFFQISMNKNFKIWICFFASEKTVHLDEPSVEVKGTVIPFFSPPEPSLACLLASLL